ncbi:MAG: OB-fold domain-containing protein [Chloroflexi bacterium]|nr:OB-fold domain-containing protein [Chloroflexota bacterium]
MPNTYNKPVPAADVLTQPFWDGCKAHELRMQRCIRCAAFIFFPSPMCHGCNGTEFRWERLSGRGTVYSFIVVYQATMPGFAQDVPYVVAWVELAEQRGLKMVSNIVGCEPEDVRAGMPVEVVFEDVMAELTLPKFRPMK